MLSIASLSSDSPVDVANIRRLFMAVPEYTQLIEGRPPGEEDVEDFFSGLPPGRTLADKERFGFWLGDDMVGCAEMLRRYPEEDVAWIGLLLLDRAHQRRGLGSTALGLLDKVAASWKAKRMGIAVVSTNLPGHAFWLRASYEETRRVTNPRYLGDMIVMQRLLAE